jgi:hypothetical protein
VALGLGPLVIYRFHGKSEIMDDLIKIHDP